MAKNRSEHESDTDSAFLDVITNCVGILIILVMVVGQQAKDAPEALAAQRAEEELNAAATECMNIEGDAHRMAAQVLAVRNELVARTAERDAVSTLVMALEADIAERRKALDEQDRDRTDIIRECALAQDELSNLKSELESIRPPAAQVVKLENRPTPLGKVVDGEQVHFQLAGGRLAYEPVAALVDEAFRPYRSKPLEEQEITGTAGPIEGFRLRYLITRIDTPRGSMTQLAGFEILPVSSEVGEPIETALAPRSQFRDKLKMVSPYKYAITVHVFDDSFAEFRVLKEELHRLGYQVSGFPQIVGNPVGFSPTGHKAVSE